MPELIAKTALEGRSTTLGAMTLHEKDPGPITSIALIAGRQALAAVSLAAVGLRFPAPNTQEPVTGGGSLVWTGRDQAFLIGAPPPVVDGAALTDQSGGWCCLSLAGPKSGDVLMRLVPLDLRPAAFPVGRAVRAGLNHMNMVLIRTDAEAFDILVFRSMARTAWHEIEAAMTGVLARG